MARRSPRQVMEDLDTVLEAVSELAPDKVFGGIPFADYNTQVGKSATVRKEVVAAEAHVTDKINERDGIDDVSLTMREKIVNGIIGDPDFGPDSTLYERCGYIRKSDRKSGLTRKGNKENK